MAIGRRFAIVSGYFNPLHIGHLCLMENAARQGGGLLVIVNNDEQQIRKKGRIVMNENDRARLVGALRVVDETRVAIDDDATVNATIRQIRADYPDAEIIFCNGGDRSSAAATPETIAAQECGIAIHYGVGGEDKADASSRIISELEQMVGRIEATDSTPGR
jgi:cytidyltransferase-like protein